MLTRIIVLAASLLWTSTAFAQLAEPLASAAAVYRASAYSSEDNLVFNEGSRIEPLLLGTSLDPDAADPLFVVDGTLGDYLHYSTASRARADLPLTDLNGSFTYAIRYRPEGVWTIRFLGSVVDANLQNKPFMLHVGSNNRPMSRVNNATTYAQVVCEGTTYLSASKTYDIVTTWDAPTRTLRLYVDGVQEASAVSTHDRSVATNSPLHVPSPNGSTIGTAGKVFGVAWDTRAWSAEEVAALDWEGESEPPPPPPEPGVLRVLVYGQEQPPGTRVFVDAEEVTHDGADPNDKIVEVVAP